MQSGFTIEVTKGGFNSGIGLKERPKFQYGSSGKPALMDVFSKLPLVNNPFLKKKNAVTQDTKLWIKSPGFITSLFLFQVKHLANENHHFRRILYPFRAEFPGNEFLEQLSFKTNCSSSLCDQIGFFFLLLRFAGSEFDWMSSRIDGFNDGEKSWKWNLVIDWNFTILIGCNFHTFHVRPIRGKCNLARLL